MKNGPLPFGSLPIGNIPGAGSSEFFQEISRFTCPVYLLIPCFPPDTRGLFCRIVWRKKSSPFVENQIEGRECLLFLLRIQTHQVRLHCQYLGIPTREDVKHEGGGIVNIRSSHCRISKHIKTFWPAVLTLLHVTEECLVVIKWRN
ncbi:hypothetical protein NC653_012690 [Populus alba x Populus x berolinensis]|uniref:Uncharacterized protein n=1 Tax=Populus alba x Populus x berolinensis TaxID=444605 RepID=A0AAD6QSJ6_9ROSI|nr:hypothetical protein NC653_012690 [Populus alba x Populus x berolinensis]